MRTGNRGQAAENGTAADGWESVRAQPDIQFAPVEMPGAEPPGWLARLLEWIGELFAPLGQLLGTSWPVLKWVLLAAAIAGLLYLLWNLLAPSLLRRRSRRDDSGEVRWVPDQEQAQALLEDADRLALEGRYDEATHLLLERSVRQIADARPGWIDASSTAREIAALPALPQAARSAFGTIAERVERSLFALRHLGEEDWQAAREAYARFMLADLGGSRA